MPVQENATRNEPYDEPGFEVKSPCGRIWFVPLEQVRQDYAEFLMQVDTLSPAAAMAKVAENEEFVPTWFCEQFDWSDVTRRGRLVRQASEEDIIRALDFLRDNSNASPTDAVAGFGVDGF